MPIIRFKEVNLTRQQFVEKIPDGSDNNWHTVYLYFCPCMFKECSAPALSRSLGPMLGFVLGRKDADSVGGSQREDRQSGGFALGWQLLLSERLSKGIKPPAKNE